jgi:hypothetical protein
MPILAGKPLSESQKKVLFGKSSGENTVPSTQQIALTRNSVPGTGYSSIYRISSRLFLLLQSAGKSIHWTQ